MEVQMYEAAQDAVFECGLLIFTIFPLKYGVNVVIHTTPHGHVSRVVQFHLPNIFIKPRYNIKNTTVRKPN